MISPAEVLGVSHPSVLAGSLEVDAGDEGGEVVSLSRCPPVEWCSCDRVGGRPNLLSASSCSSCSWMAWASHPP